MASEFQQLQNPDNVPGRVSSGYQRQNTNIFAIQTGLDTTEPYDDGNGAITIPAGGIVELNGVMFKLTATITLQKPTPAQAYWVAITDNGDGVGDAPSTASASLVDSPGAWNPAKKGCYRADGSRTLNWVSLGDIDLNAGFTQVFNSTINGQVVKNQYAIQLRPGWYYVNVTSGMGSGNGARGGDGRRYGEGGIGGGGGTPSRATSADKIFFFDKSERHTIKVGADGGYGGDGGMGGDGGGGTGYDDRGGAGGGGGAGGAGESTSFDNLESGECPGGEGGEGGASPYCCSGGGGAGVPGGSFSPNANANYDRSRDGRTGGSDNGGDGGGIGASIPVPWGTLVPFGGRGGRGRSLSGSAGAAGINGGAGVNGGGGGGGGKGVDGKNRPNGAPGGHCEVWRIRDHNPN